MPADGQALLHLLRLASATLPVGAFAFSQGLEAAVEAGWITDAESARDALELLVRHQLARTELPIYLRAHRAARAEDGPRLRALTELALACRETRELRAAEAATGAALVRLLASLGEAPPRAEEASFVVAFGFAAARRDIAERAGGLGLGWTWLENQVAALTRLVPLGQTDAQRLLVHLGPGLEAAWARALEVEEGDIGSTLPALAIASCHHETQHSRLFRS